jgi:hypothetical protein
MQSDAPVVRASYAKTVIGTMKQRSPVDRDALLDRVNRELRDEIRERGMLDWITAQQFSKLVDVVFEALGAARAREFWRVNLQTSLERALLSPLRLGAVALYGKNPGALLRMTPQAWQLVSRNCGLCRVTEQLPEAIGLRFEALPDIFRNSAMLALWSGGSESCLERMNFDGEVAATIDPQRRSAVELHVTWRARR